MEKECLQKIDELFDRHICLSNDAFQCLWGYRLFLCRHHNAKIGALPMPQMNVLRADSE